MVADTLNSSSIDDALALIDGQLAIMAAREIVSAADVSDLLLDLRLLLQPIPEPTEILAPITPESGAPIAAESADIAE